MTMAPTNAKQLTVLTLVDGFYEEQVFRGDDAIAYANFPPMNLTVAAVLQAGT